MNFIQFLGNIWGVQATLPNVASGNTDVASGNKLLPQDSDAT